MRPRCVLMGAPPGPGVEVIRRIAVRAIVERDGNVLMLHARSTGGHKFPGGGVEPGEDDAAALARELEEECGRALVGIGPLAITVTETRAASEGPGAAFQMESRYYICRVGEADRPARLEDDETSLGLHQVWVTPRDAVAEADRVLGTGQAPAWMVREREVLCLL